MKIHAVIDIEHQVTEEANIIGSCEKAVWASVWGVISCSTFPEVGKIIWIPFLGDTVDSKQPFDVTASDYVMGQENVLTPRIYCEYVLPAGMDNPDLKATIESEKKALKNEVLPRFLRRGFSLKSDVQYSVRPTRRPMRNRNAKWWLGRILERNPDCDDTFTRFIIMISNGTNESASADQNQFGQCQDLIGLLYNHKKSPLEQCESALLIATYLNSCH